MSISREDVHYVANLSRLELQEGEEESLCQELGSILGYIDTLQAVDIEGVEPYISAAAAENVFRDDVAYPSLSHEKALQNAPDSDGKGFVVPKVVGGTGGDA